MLSSYSVIAGKIAEKNELITAVVILAVIAALATAAFIVIRITKAPIYGLISKIIASVCFMLIATVGVYMAVPYYIMEGTEAALLIPLGLVFGLIGDIVLDARRAHPDFLRQYTWTGMLSFVCGHVIYVLAVFLIAQNLGNKDGGNFTTTQWIISTVVSAVVGIIVGVAIVIVSEKTMNAKFGEFKIISICYGGLLIFFTVLTIFFAVYNPRFIILAVAMVLFLASDAVLSQMYFVEGKGEDKILVAANHGLYYSAQILIACFLFVLAITA
ncbi:MAG: lysoplasmalogenase [Christensenellaceae bacterium]|jgi:hypothetical protein|nr:lysoplasmalogenase [Christensenellaceae bacterium]